MATDRRGVARAGTPRVGISGWRYTPWRGEFYPKGLVQRDELAYASERLTSIEINGSFYSLQRPTSYALWKEQTPDDFVFSVKGGRYITHLLRLKNAHGALANFFASGVLGLGEKLGPFLWQLPERVEFDATVLDEFLAQLPRTTTDAAALAAESSLESDRTLTTVDVDRPLRHALEVRSPTFDTAEAFEIVRRHDVALVIADTAGTWPMLREITSDFVYVRLHGAEELYASGYDAPALDRWEADIRSWLDGSGSPDGRPRDVFVYFDNDLKVRAPFDAMALIERLR
jgi:uncharacterized protein YecE (DUF72 family)